MPIFGGFERYMHRDFAKVSRNFFNQESLKKICRKVCRKIFNQGPVENFKSNPDRKISTGL
jgi:hypothetical protein